MMIKPDYQRENVTLYRDDCMDILPQLPDNSVDCVVTDPPFFMPATHYQSRVNFGRSWSDAQILTFWWGETCKKINIPLKETGHICVFCNGDSYPAFYPAMYPIFTKLKALVWVKGDVGLGRIFRHQHELVLWGRNEGHYFCSDGVLRSDVGKFKAKPTKDRDHPVEKPPDMLEWLVVPLSPLAGLVLDPFMGSGTTGVACIKTNRKFIGIELDPDYFNIAVERIETAFEQAKQTEFPI